MQPGFLRHYKWKVTEFEYNNTGIKKLSCQGEEFLKPIWSINAITQKLTETGIYNDVCKNISENYNLNDSQINGYLHQFITRLANKYLENEIKSLFDANKYIESFLRDLNNENQECRAKIYLHGLILEPDLIKLDNNTTLRKPIREDFEREVLIGANEQSSINPTALLIINTFIDRPNNLIHEIDQDVAILRLFRVGSIQNIRYDLTTDSIIKLASSSSWSGKSAGVDKYLIDNNDIDKLKAFWSSVKGMRLPDSAFIHKPQIQQQDEISIAYQRYCDSLEIHLLEKRISSAVMGLEALYLQPNERQELTYRLSMRTGKLLSYIGYNAEKVRNDIVHAYDIRSTYVHGKILTQKLKNKHEKGVGELNQFSRTIMDYLRASIVVLLKRPSKNSLVKNIDFCFLNSGAEETVKKLLFIPN